VNPIAGLLQPDVPAEPCYTTFLWQAASSRGIIIITPRDGRCNNFHSTNGKDARRETGGLFLFLR